MNYPCYHVITRGNQRQIVFTNEKDYTIYLEILQKAKRKYHILLYSYCLLKTMAFLFLSFHISLNKIKI